MTTGELIFVTFVSDARDRVWVTQYTVLDAENRIVKRQDDGQVRVLAKWESVHATEAEAWRRAQLEILSYAENLRIKADECAKKAAAAVIVKVPA